MMQPNPQPTQPTTTDDYPTMEEIEIMRVSLRVRSDHIDRLERDLAAAEQVAAQAQTLRAVLSYAVEALDTERWRSLLGTEWLEEARAALNPHTNDR